MKKKEVIEYVYGGFFFLFADRDIEIFDMDLQAGYDTPRTIAVIDAGEQGLEILEGPPAVELLRTPGGKRSKPKRQIWKYPARRRV